MQLFICLAFICYVRTTVVMESDSAACPGSRRVSYDKVALS